MKIEGKEGVVEHFLMDVENRLGKLTYKSYRQRLGVLVDFLRDRCQVADIEQVTTLHLRQCVQHLLADPVAAGHNAVENSEGMLAASTVGSYIRVWKAFFSWCYQEELIGGNPAGRLKAPKVEKKIRPTFAQEAIERMIAACDASTAIGFRNYVILLLLLDTGIRRAEIADLTLDDIHIQEEYIKVHGKGRKEREVGIHPEMGKLLWKYIGKYRRAVEDDDKGLFQGRSGSLTPAGVAAIVKSIQRKSGLVDIEFHPHVFRHTFAKMYLERGGEIFKLSREMGHSSVQVTNIYLQDFGSRQARKEHNSHSPLSSLHLKKSGKKKKEGD